MKNNNLEPNFKRDSGIIPDLGISNKPGRRSNPIPAHPEEEEDPVKPGKEDPAKKKKKKSVYEVTY